MVKKQGHHLKPSETKSYIIEYILGNSGPVGEPTIRDHLKEKYDLRDQGTINRHLHYLKNLGCIELIQTEKSLRNKWDITKAEHLINIRNEISNIQLNKYKKSLMIVLKKSSYNIFTLAGLILYAKLFLSVSFFNACLGTDIEILGERVWEIYRIKNRAEFSYIDESVNSIYITYIIRYMWLNIPKKSFVSMIDQMSQRELVDSTETFMKIWEEELLGLSKETLDKMHLKKMEEDLKIYKSIRDITSKLSDHKSIFEAKLFELLFESYLYQDILDGVASEEEIELLIGTYDYRERKLKELENIGDYLDYNNDKYLMYMDNLILICILLSKHKNQSTLGPTYSNLADELGDIMKILDQHNQLPAISDKIRDIISNIQRA